MEEMRLVSIDASTKKTGCALFKNGELSDYKLIDLENNKDSEIRMNCMIKEILKFLKQTKPHEIWIEHPQGGGRNVLVVSKLSEIIGSVRAYAVERECLFHELNPSEWRAYAGIEQGKKKREELKQSSIDYVKEHFGLEVEDDLADAISIGCAVINFYNKI